jgi:hypothetical protein
MMAAERLAAQSVGGDPIPVRVTYKSKFYLTQLFRHTPLPGMKGYIFNSRLVFMNIEMPSLEPVLEGYDGRSNSWKVR